MIITVLIHIYYLKRILKITISLICFCDRGFIKSKYDKYEYIIPNYDFSKETYLNESFFDTFTFLSNGNYRKFNTNVDEMDVTNDFNLPNMYEFDNLTQNLIYYLEI